MSPPLRVVPRRGTPAEQPEATAPMLALSPAAAGAEGRDMIRWMDRWRDDSGMATTEYALVTVAAAAFAGILIALVRSDEVRELLAGILRSAFG